MPKISTTNGAIHYKSIPIYEGIKYIDKEKSLQNLIVFKEILDAHRIPFFLAYGTLLGACREHDFITHDEDIDLALLEEDRQRLFDTLPELMRKGFCIARWDRKGCMSIMRDGEYMDMYFFHKMTDKVRACSGNLMPSVFLEETDFMEFKGLQILAPRDYEWFLRYEYGENWHIPVVFQNFGMNWFQRAVRIGVSMVKEYLPDCLYFPLSAVKEKHYQRRYDQKIERYFNEQSNK
ncbi:MAG: LicD family protein [Bacteroidaceae bacterium]|nr:LicD family protein [Bacteroidaceae bacterium]